MSTEMKKLIIGSTEYEIVDDTARTNISGHETRISEMEAVIESIPSDYTELSDEVDDVNKALDDISISSKNLYNPSTAVVGIVNSSGGITSASQYSEYLTSDYINLDGATYFSVLGAKPFGFALYRADKTFIERLTGSNAPKDTAYSTDRSGVSAVYLRITWRATNADYAQAMVILGNDLTTQYEPYGRTVILPNDAITTDNISNTLESIGTYTADTYDPTFFPPKVRQTAWRGNTRNASGESIAPENSWSAYENAVSNGFDMLWIAVIQYSSSGKFYCSHDNELTIGGVTDQFYNFTDERIESYTLSDGSKIPIFTDVLKYCALHGMPVGIRLGRLPTAYDDTTIGNTSITRKAIWNSFIGVVKRYNIELNIFSGSDSQCDILHSFIPYAHVQNTSNKSNSESDLLNLIQRVKNVGSKRCSVNVYITNASNEIILTENVMDVARENNVKVFAVTSEPIASSNEINVIKNLCPDYIITHSKLNF